MEDAIRLTTPLKNDALEKLKIGDRVQLTGIIYAARDAAHQRMVELLEKDAPLPFDLEGQVIYYVGPSPAKPNEVVGAAGPTSSYRMDSYAPLLLEKGLKGMIGKGARNQTVRAAMKKHKAIYIAAVGGAGALIARSILSQKIIAYPELDSEAIREMEVKDFPGIVANDIHGGDLYEAGVEEYRL